MLLNSTFPAEALERLRAQRLVALTQARAQPGAIAGRVFPKVLYGPAHPYGRVATEDSIKAITRDDIVAFHSQYFQPGRALVTVVGDVTAAAREAGRREGAGRVAEGRDAADVRVSGGARAPEDDDLSRRPARRGAVDRCDRPSRPAAQHAGLLRAAGDEHHARRHVPVAPERQHPRGEGLQLRRQLRASRLARARAPSAPAATSSATRPTRRWWSS